MLIFMKNLGYFLERVLIKLTSQLIINLLNECLIIKHLSKKSFIFYIINKH